MGTTVPLQPIAAVEINLDKLFTDEYEFVIPEYQRPYTWGVEHAVQLLVDLQHWSVTWMNHTFWAPLCW